MLCHMSLGPRALIHRTILVPVQPLREPDFSCVIVRTSRQKAQKWSTQYSLPCRNIAYLQCAVMALVRLCAVCASLFALTQAALTVASGAYVQEGR